MTKFDRLPANEDPDDLDIDPPQEDAFQFVRQVAEMTRYSDNPEDVGLIADIADAADVLNALILRARGMLKLPTPSAEERERAEADA